jgi:DNA polymerase
MMLLGTDYTLLTLDFEIYYGPKYSLSLQTMNTFKYVADEQFLIHGVGVKIDDNPTKYFDFHTDHGRRDFERCLSGLTDKPVALLCQNTPFDGFILHYHFDWHPDLYLDTMAMSRGLFVGQKAGLHDIAIRLWPHDPNLRKLDDLKLTYGLRELPPDINQKLTAYCIRDVDLTHAAFAVMEPHFPDDELRLIDWTIRAMCEPVFEVDTQLVQDEIDYQVSVREAAIQRAQDEFGLTESRVKSDKQFREFLESRGVKIELKENAKGEMIPALGQKDWGYQKMMARHPELEAVWAARKVAKSNIQESRARWFKAVAEWNDNKMPVPLNYYGADTGRWSGGEKLNLQNLPRNTNGDEITDPNSGRLRRSLLAPEGKVVVVRDLNNIEGRMLAWEAGEGYLLDLFRNDGCPYLFMAEEIFNASHGSFSKKTHGDERTIGKVAVLGLGYGMSANKFWIGVNTGANPAGIKRSMSFEEAQRIVDIYRGTNTNITRFWRDCEQLIIRMAGMKPGETWEFGPLTVMKEMLVMPNGMALQYPRLEGEPNQFGGYDFTFGVDKRKKIYGAHLAENCIAEGALVLTDNGWKVIETIKPTDKVHDGVEFVSHGGCIFKSVQSCVTVDGVLMTPDHEVLTDEGWKPASQNPRPYRPDIRISDSFVSGTERREKTEVVDAMHLRETLPKDRSLLDQIKAAWENAKLWMQKGRTGPSRKNHAWDVTAPGVRRMALDDRQVPITVTSRLEKLRWAWNSRVRQVAEHIRELLGRHGPVLPARTIAGAQGQLEGVLARELCMGNAYTTEQKPSYKHSDNNSTWNNDSRGDGRKSGAQSQYAAISSSQQLASGQAADTAKLHQPRKVYDILNCGPRSRFVVKGDSGPFIVHNCTQALARVLLGQQLLTIQSELDSNYGRDAARVVHSVHDELIVICDEDKGDEVYCMMGDVMSTPPDWAPDLPLKSEGGVAREYSK